MGANNVLSAASLFSFSAPLTGCATMLDLAGWSQAIPIDASVANTTALTSVITNSSIFPSTLTLAGAWMTNTFNGLIAGPVDLTLTGAGSRLTLGSANTYDGYTTINAGTLALSSSGSINNTPQIAIAAGANYDVSAFTNYVLSSGTSLSASGAGTVANFNAATIRGSTTINLGSRPDQPEIYADQFHWGHHASSVVYFRRRVDAQQQPLHRQQHLRHALGRRHLHLDPAGKRQHRWFDQRLNALDHGGHRVWFGTWGNG